MVPPREGDIRPTTLYGGRNLEALAVGARQKSIRLLVAEEDFPGRIEPQPPADPVLHFVDRQTVLLQMLLCPPQRLRRDLVVSEKGPGIVEWFCRAQAIAYVAQMAQGAGQVPLEDVSVQQFWLAVPHGLDEVGEVVAAAVEPGQHFPLGRKSHSVETVADEVAVAAMEDVADRGPLVVLGRQAAHLEDQLAV